MLNSGHMGRAGTPRPSFVSKQVEARRSATPRRYTPSHEHVAGAAGESLLLSVGAAIRSGGRLAFAFIASIEVPVYTETRRDVRWGSVRGCTLADYPQRTHTAACDAGSGVATKVDRRFRPVQDMDGFGRA